MRHHRFVALFLLLLLCVTGFTVGAQEATTEATAEATETADATEATDTPSPTTTAVADDGTPTGAGGTYVVQPGDNLYRIALRHGITTRQLAEANGIASPSLIFVGQRLIIPGATAITPTATPTLTPLPETDDEESTTQPTGTYTVQAGDTLFRIASRNNTTVAELIRLNSISNSNFIFVGQQLRLPGGTTTPSTTDGGTTPAPSLDMDFGTGVEVFLGQDINAVSAQATQLGVDWVKITVNWGEVEATKGDLQLGAIDQAVETFDGAGLNLMLTLIGTPEWAIPSATELALSVNSLIPPDNLNDFGTFAGAVAERYAGRVDAYEIWSEPNIRLNWMTPNVTLRGDDRPDARLAPVRYIDLLKAAHDAIKASDPDALVVTAGLAPTGWDDGYNAIDTFVFFEALLKQGALNFSDAVGVHLDGYSNAPDAACCGTKEDTIPFNETYHFFFAEMLDNYREILDRNSGDETAIFVTRFGWGTGENASAAPSSESSYLSENTASEQAQFTVDAFTAGSERGDIGAMVLYNLNGCAIGDNDACFYSAIGADGAARPLFSAVQNLDLSAETPEAVATVEPAPTATVQPEQAATVEPELESTEASEG